MKNRITSFCMSVIAVLIFAIPHANADAATSYDGLVKTDQRGMDQVWVRPGFAPSSYTKILIKDAGISYRPVKRGHKNEFFITNKNRSKLEGIVSKAFKKQLQDAKSYEIASKPGPDTLELAISLHDVVSKVPPQKFGRVDVYIDEIGSATLVLEFKDSLSGATMVRGVDRRAAESYGWGELQKSTPISNWAAVKQLARVWSAGLKKGLKVMSTSPEFSE